MRAVASESRGTYGLCDVVDDDGAVRIPVVHGRQGLVPLLPSRIPNLKFDGRVFIEGDGLCEEGGADGRFSVRVELVLRFRSAAARGAGTGGMSVSGAPLQIATLSSSVT